MSILRRNRGAQNSPGKLSRIHSIVCFDLAFRSLEEIEKRSRAILDKNTAAGFLDKAKDSQEVINLVDELRNAIVAYQVGKKHITLPSTNTSGIALAATVNVQPDWKTGCRSLIPTIYHRTDEIPRLPLTHSEDHIRFDPVHPLK